MTRTPNQDPERRDPTARATDGREVRERLLAVHADATAFYRHHLTHSWVPDYLGSRGLGAALAPSPELVGTPGWQIGYAPGGWNTLTSHLRELGYADTTLTGSGLAVTASTGRLIDRFRDRLMLPITDHAGRTIAFTARAAPHAPATAPKYLSSPTTALYAKSEHLYGAHLAAHLTARGATPVLVEGPLDAIAVTTAGHGHLAGVAACGTAITPAHAITIRHLPRPHVQTSPSVVVALDPDPAGWDATEPAYRALTSAGLLCLAPQAMYGDDPASCLQERGAAALCRQLRNPVPLAVILIDRHLFQRQDRFQWVEDRVGAVRAVAPLLADLTGDTRKRMVQNVAEQTGADPYTVRRELAAVRLQRHQTVRADDTPALRHSLALPSAAITIAIRL